VFVGLGWSVSATLFGDGVVARMTIVGVAVGVTANSSGRGITPGAIIRVKTKE
jgi:hypothetical protein